jgi:signal transduction histidine kinase/DNA-binding XRE family transcriptional regulator
MYYRALFTCFFVSIISFTYSQIDQWESLVTEDPSQENLSLLHKMVDHYTLRDTAKAYSYSELAINMAQSLDDDAALAHAYLDLSYIYQKNFNYNEALKWQEEAKSIFERIDNTRGLALINEAIGLAEVKQGYHDESLLSFSKALSGFEKIDDTLSILKCYYHLGYSHYRMRNFDSTIYYYFKVLPFCDESVTSNCIDVFNQLGATYTEIQKYDKATHYLNRSLDASLLKNDLRLAGIAVMNIAGNYFFQGKLDSCAMYLDQAIQLAEESGDEQGKVIGLNNLSIIYEENGQYDESMETALKAIDAARVINDRNIMAGSYVQVMDMSTKMNKPTQAILYGDSAMTLLTDLKSDYHFQQYYLSLSEAYIKQNDFRKAMEFKELYHAYSDSMVNEQKNQQIAEIETKYETEKKEQEIEILSTQNQLQAATIDRNRLLIALIAVSSILGVGIIFIFFRQRNYKMKAQFESEKSALKSQQIEAVINTQEAERSRFAMDLHDNFGQLISALRLITSQHEDTKTSTDQLLDNMYASLKNLAFDLMPATLVQKDLVSAVDELATQINQSKSVHMKVTAFVQELPFDKKQEIGIYRIIQELSSNILKYADAQNITLDFTQQNHELQIMITDDGTGYDTLDFFNSSSNGWKNISSRLDLLNGDMEIDSSKGSKGSTVIINIPILLLTQAA